MTANHRRYRIRSWKPNLEALEERCVPTSSWNNFGGNPQHTGVSTVASQPMDTILWQMSIDQQPGGAEHYGEPVLTPSNTVLVPVKTGSSAAYLIEGINGATGAVLWSAATDYTQPFNYNWLPPFQSVYDPFNDRVYFAGNGGTIYYINHPDNPGSSNPPPTQLAFFGISNYNSNPGAYNASIFIDSPLTVDTSGNVFFGFTETGSNPSNITQGGIARIGADGSGTYILAGDAAGTGSNVDEAALGSAPAISNDGTLVYAALNSKGNSYNGYLVGLNSTTLARTYSVQLFDPASGNPAGVIRESTAGPMVAPDNTVFQGVFGNPYNGSRGFLLHFSSDLTTEYYPGAFGWDDTPSIIPTSMVPSYQGSSSYLVLSKYNNYVAAEVGTYLGGNGVNKIAVLDPYASQLDPNYDYNPNLQVMKQVLTMASPTPDSSFDTSGYLDSVREWCTNGTAVDPASHSVFINNEDGYAYRWNLKTNVLTQAVEITDGIGEPYTPTAIGPDGTIYAINGGTLFALGGYPNYTENFLTSLHPSVVGQSITFTTTLASTSGGATPTGTVTYTYTEGANDPFNSTPIFLATVNVDSNGVATYSTSSLGAGHYHLVAAYSGDSTYGPGSAARVQAILDTTTLSLTSSAPFAALGSSVTLTATLSPSSTSFVPLGFVTFKDGSTVLATEALPSYDSPNYSTTTQVSFTTSSLGVGVHQIKAFYSGDMNFARNISTALAETINGTNTTLSSAVNPSVFGQPVTFTAVVTPISTSGTPTGTVTFYRGSTSLGSATLDSTGTATFTTSSLPVGVRSIKAVYGGDPNDAGSTSTILRQTITRDSTTTTVVSSANPSVFGQSVTFTATVTANAPGSGIPDGSVSFKVNGTILGTATLDPTGVATFTTSAFHVGHNNIVAVYGGSGSYKNSRTTTLVQLVNKDDTTTTLQSSVNPSVYGQSVTFTATVTANAPGSGTPGGTITFRDNGVALATVTLDANGVATFTTSTLYVGNDKMVAAYSGSADYRVSRSAPLIQVVNKDATLITLSSSLNPSVFGESVIFSVTVTAAPPGSGVPTGTITFYDGSAVLGTATLDSTGSASLTISNLGVGNHNITARYGGDGHFKFVVSSVLVQTVTAGPASPLGALLSSFLDKAAIDRIFGI